MRFGTHCTLADPEGVQGPPSETKLFHCHGIFKNNKIKFAK